jgi:hypothetical protein
VKNYLTRRRDSEEISQPFAHPLDHAIDRRTTRGAREGTIGDFTAGSEEDQPGGGCKLGPADGLHKAPEPLTGHAEANAAAEAVLGQPGDSVEHGATAAQNDAGAESVRVATPLDLLRDEPEDLIGALLDDVGQELARDLARG